jgi:excisionase family DNA binding protein
MSPSPQLVEAPRDDAELVRDPASGFTVADLAKRLRVGTDKIRKWINRGELKAVNVAASVLGKPRWVIPADALAEFQTKRRSGPAPKPPRRRRRAAEIDFF